MNPTAIDALSVPEAAEQRRSIRAFEPDPIPREEMDRILDVVRRAPSAFNLQPWRFVVVESPELRERLAAAARNQRQVRSAPATVVLYTDMEDALATVEEVLHPGMDEAKRAGTAAGIRNFFNARTPEARDAWGEAQGHIALGYLVLAAESLGYRTSPMAGFDANAVRSLLGLPESARIPALIAIGRGAEPGFPSHRHPLERLVRVA